MTVAVFGGCYGEIVRDQNLRRLMGSGMRAAATLSSLGVPVRLFTRVDGSSREEAEAVAAAYGVATEPGDRAGTVTFDYPVSFAEPVVRAQDAHDLRGAASWPSAAQRHEAAVVFGMVEGPSVFESDVLVLDPQHATLEEAGYRAGVAGRAALVANAREVARLSPAQSPARAATQLLHEGFEVVVVKCGALGTLVVTADEPASWLPARPTRSVAALGTGDVFSAAFARYWLRGEAPVVAAANASAATAWYATTGSPDLPPGWQPEVSSEAGEWAADARPRIYLAGPFFDPGQMWLVETVRRGLIDIGAEVFSPLHDVAQFGDDATIARSDLQGLESCDAVLALLDGSDTGTLFECGYAHAKGIPVVAVARDPGRDEWLMLRGAGATLTADVASGAYRACWEGLSRLPARGADG